MKVGFYSPPAHQSLGGLELAIRSIKEYLQRDCLVELEPPDPGSCDLIHFHGLWQPRFHQLAARCQSASIPYVISPHGMLEPWAWQHKWWKKWPYYLLFEQRFLSQAASLLATSPMEKQNLQRFTALPAIEVIPLSITTEHGPDYEAARRKLGWVNQEFVLLFLSRLHPKKGVHLLFQALCKLSRLKQTLRVVVVGDGSQTYKDHLCKFVRLNQHRLPTVEFTGPIWGPEKWTFLQGADLFCLPTYSENFGLAILEACQVGTPVLTTVTTPWKEFLEARGFPVVRPSKNGVLAGLTDFIERGKLSSDHRYGLAEEARRRFSPSLVSGQYLHYYLGILSSRFT